MYVPYVGMQKLRLPEGSIRQKMRRDGLCDSEIEGFFQPRLNHTVSSADALAAAPLTPPASSTLPAPLPLAPPKQSLAQAQTPASALEQQALFESPISVPAPVPTCPVPIKPVIPVIVSPLSMTVKGSVSGKSQHARRRSHAVSYCGMLKKRNASGIGVGSSMKSRFCSMYGLRFTYAAIGADSSTRNNGIASHYTVRGIRHWAGGGTFNTYKHGFELLVDAHHDDNNGNSSDVNSSTDAVASPPARASASASQGSEWGGWTADGKSRLPTVTTTTSIAPEMLLKYKFHSIFLAAPSAEEKQKWVLAVEAALARGPLQMAKMREDEQHEQLAVTRKSATKLRAGFKSPQGPQGSKTRANTAEVLVSSFSPAGSRSSGSSSDGAGNDGRFFPASFSFSATAVLAQPHQQVGQNQQVRLPSLSSMIITASISPGARASDATTTSTTATIATTATTATTAPAVATATCTTPPTNTTCSPNASTGTNAGYSGTYLSADRNRAYRSSCISTPMHVRRRSMKRASLFGISTSFSFMAANNTAACAVLETANAGTAAVFLSDAIGLVPAGPPPPLVSESVRRESRRRSRSSSYSSGAKTTGLGTAGAASQQLRRLSVPVISTKLARSMMPPPQLHQP